MRTISSMRKTVNVTKKYIRTRLYNTINHRVIFERLCYVMCICCVIIFIVMKVIVNSRGSKKNWLSVSKVMKEKERKKSF